MDRLQELAEKHGVRLEVVHQVYTALIRTGGKQAQFNHPDLGGMGQWMPGMVMVGRMFDNVLKAKVDALCTEVASLVAAESAPVAALPVEVSGWWPDALGAPNAAGSQNGIRYAYFAAPNRLVIERNGIQRTYDTTGYRIHGVSQQQSNSDATLTFTSDQGLVRLEDLPTV